MPQESTKQSIETTGRSEWRPIETAPKDGTVIDVWLGDADDSDIAFYCTPGTRRSAGWHWKHEKFRPTAGLNILNTWVLPTHWMPLPEPPNDVQLQRDMDDYGPEVGTDR